MSSLHTNTFTGVFTFNVICPVIFIPFPLYFAHLFRCLERSQEVFSRGGLKRSQVFRPCAHDALQGPEESVHLWIVPLSLAVSVTGAVHRPELRQSVFSTTEQLTPDTICLSLDHQQETVSMANFETISKLAMETVYCSWPNNWQIDLPCKCLVSNILFFSEAYVLMIRNV